MKILHLIDSGGLYGAEKMLLSLVQEQIRLGLDPMILSAGAPDIEEKAIEREAERLGLPLIKWRMKPGLNIPEALKIVRWTRKNQFNIVHSHGYKFNILMGFLSIFTSFSPIVTTIHGYVRGKVFSKIWIYELFDKLLMRKVKKIVVVDNGLLHKYPFCNLPSDRVDCVPNGISLKNFDKPDFQLRSDILDFAKKHEFSLVGIGRLSPEKGFDIAIDALSKLVSDGFDIGLCIMGEGGLEKQLKAQVNELGLGDRILFTGYVDNASCHIRVFDALIMPSRTEGLPITLLEAMASKTPVIASSVGAIPEVIDGGKAGWLVEPGSIAGLENGIVDFMNRPKEASQKAKVGYLYVKDVYSDEAMGESYKKIYESIIV